MNIPFIPDGYSPAPSMCVSLNSPEPIRNYPRGIINPNYPGFQHLAHTLSEHFIDHQFGNMSDSDVSEFECDVPADKHLGQYKNTYQPNRHFVDNNNSINNNTRLGKLNGSHTNPFINININNNNNNNENLDKVEQMIRNAFESEATRLPETQVTNVESDIENNVTVLGGDEFGTMDNVQEDIRCDLSTYLKRYDDEAAIDVEAAGIIGDKNLVTVQPPDILLKSTVSEESVQIIEEEPDILKNVCKPLDQLDFEELKQCERRDAACDTIPCRDREDQTPWSITPVDIVGDFEQEVEREFGLLVSGYRNNGSFEQSDEFNETVFDLEEEENFNGNFLDKVSDSISIPFS